MRVVVIPEDSRKDKFALKPIVEALMAQLGKPAAKVRVCEDPVLGGVEEALKPERIRDVISLYPMANLLLLIVDRDGEEHRSKRIERIEGEACGALKAGQALLGENAWQEVEVWILAGHDLPADWQWKEVRAEVNPKERYFQPFAVARGVAGESDGGRGSLAAAAARRFDRVLRLCPEDLGNLATRIRGLMPS
ncbi:MAG: hypothetical protein FJ087_13390 [Deltaproteobacteria bacterium]|nr:hypothetical protein [Deltaproteobacteria bacterium]